MRTNRLASLDILRGADLFCLLFLQPILIHWLEIADMPALTTVQKQFEHIEWHGFSFWDLIMPLFMFMSGITIPFALSRYKNEKSIDRTFYIKIAKRFCWLFFLGWIVQGNLLALDMDKFHVFANTLQAIAVGYVVAAILYVHCSTTKQILFCVTSFLLYIIVFAYWGNMNFAPTTNIAETIDRTILGKLRDGIIWQDDIWHFDDSYHYTWILSSLNFIVTVMLGMFAGIILKNNSYSEIRKFILLIGLGAIFIISSLILDPYIPIIKKIWSSSMTMYSGGICFILMGLFYYIIDIKKVTKLKWLKYYGMNSIIAYCIFEVISFRSIADSLLFGLEQWLGIYYPLIGTISQCIIVFLILRWMYKHQIFIKV